MKILTLQFLTCAIKSCKQKTLHNATTTAASSDDSTSIATSSGSPFPLHPSEATLSRTELVYNPLFILNILPRLDWPALKITATELGVLALLPGKGGDGEIKGVGGKWEEITADPEMTWREMMLERVNNDRGEMAGDDDDDDKDDDEEAEGEGQEKGEGDITMTEPETTTQKRVEDEDDKILRNLHSLLLETELQDGKLVCGSCGFEYGVKDGVGNFLLPSHLVS